MKKTIIFASVGFLALSALSLTQASSDSIEKSFNVDTGGTLYIDSDAGAIEIVPHNSDTVDVRVDKRGKNADDFTVTFEQDGSDVKIKGDKDSGWGNFSLSVRYVVKVPTSYNLDLKTGGGSIEIEDLNGKIQAYTSGGSIKLGKIVGDVEVKTSGGSITVGDVSGNIDAHTSGGSIKAELSKQLTDDCTLSTSGGSISVELVPSMAVNLDASTSGGRVKSEFDVDGKVKKNRIRGSINGGGPELKLKTSGGSVNIRKL